MNAKVNIEIGVMSKERLNYERFRPSQTYTHAFRYETDLDHYSQLTNSYALAAFNYVQSEYTRGVLEMELHVAVTLENATAPVSGKGVVPRAKGRVDSALTDVEFSSVSVLKELIDTSVENLREIAKY